MLRGTFGAALVAVILSIAAPAFGCGALVSGDGQAELDRFQALLAHDGQTEQLVVSISYDTYEDDGGDTYDKDARGKSGSFAWLMPFPTAPEVSEGERAGLDAAFALTEAPDKRDHVPSIIPFVCGCGADEDETAIGVEELGRSVVENLEFVTLGGTDADEIAGWMDENGFTFHDRQAPVLQSYLDRDWVVVAARVLPGEAEAQGRLVPVRFEFDTPEPVYPLAIAGSDHEEEELRMSILTVTPYRPAAEGVTAEATQPDDDGYYPEPEGMEMRYSAPLDAEDAERISASADVEEGQWLTRFEGSLDAQTLDEDLTLARAQTQDVFGYEYLLDGWRTDRYLAYGGQVLVALLILAPFVIFFGGIYLILRFIVRRIRT